MLGRPGAGGGGVLLVPACGGTMGTSPFGCRWDLPGPQLRLVSAGWSIHMGQSSRGCSLVSTFPVFEAVWLFGCWGGGAARRGGGGGTLCVWIPVSLSGVVCVAWSTRVVGLVRGLVLCPRPVSGRGPSLSALDRGGYEAVVFCGSFCVVVPSWRVPRCPHRAFSGVCLPVLRGCVAHPSGSR